MSEVFKGAFKNPDNKFRYDYGEQQQNLLRDGKLVGLRVVKSLQPLDPANGNNPNSILQTYHIPVQLTEDNQQIRLFDSQITYGQDYYYTLYGIYSVDGKFYYYDNTDLQIVPAVLEEKIIEEKAVINNVQKVAKGSFEFINPCCRYQVPVARSPVMTGHPQGICCGLLTGPGSCAGLSNADRVTKHRLFR